jgi:hypothetical protein
MQTPEEKKSPHIRHLLIFFLSFRFNMNISGFNVFIVLGILVACTIQVEAQGKKSYYFTLYILRHPPPKKKKKITEESIV